MLIVDHHTIVEKISLAKCTAHIVHKLISLEISPVPKPSLLRQGVGGTSKLPFDDDGVIEQGVIEPSVLSFPTLAGLGVE